MNREDITQTNIGRGQSLGRGRGRGTGKSQSAVLATIKREQSPIDDQQSKCNVCDRPKANITCEQCGKSWKGRLRIPCAQHKHQVFLMDFDTCINCQSKSLKEMAEK